MLYDKGEMIMRKVLAYCCLAASVVIGVILNHIAVMIAKYRIDSKLAMLIFIPVFIVMYWLGTFFEQLIVKDNALIFTKPATKILRAVYTVSVLSVCAVWLWIIYKYTYFFGDIIADIKEWLG